MPMFGIFYSGEEILFSWDTIGNIAERRKHLLEEMPVMVYRLYEYIIKAKLTHRYEKKALKDLFYRVGRSTGKVHVLRKFLTTLQNFIKIHKIDVSREEMFDYATRKEILIQMLNACTKKESIVTEINSWVSGFNGCGFQVRVNL